jgi:glycosyltransferase involved in cell wall biosynthesis
VAQIEGKLSVIMPAFNEAAAIHACLQETLKVLEGNEFEIIVVDDGSTDETLPQVERISRRDGRVRVVRYPHNGGKGCAICYGFQFATGRLIALLDADLDLHPGHLLVLYDQMSQTGCDIVIGSKRHPQSQVNYPWHRRLYSFTYFLLVRLLFNLPIHDTQTGVKLFRRRSLELAMPRMLIKQFAYDLELLVICHRLGFSVREAPVTIHFKRAMSRIGLRTAGRIWWDTMAIFYRTYLLRYYDGHKPDRSAETYQV